MKVTLYEHEVVLTHALEAGSERHQTRTRFYLDVSDHDSSGMGEVAPQPTALNGDPSVDEVRNELLTVALPQLLAMSEREGVPPSWARINRLRAPRSASATALALIEMALLDRELRASRERLDDRWRPRQELALQRGVSLIRGDDAWPDLTGVTRLRAKVGPRRVDEAALARVAATALPVILDFNATAHTLDEVLDVWRVVSDRLDVVAIEQPFRVGNLIDCAQLRGRVPVAISLDESVRSLGDLEQIVRYDAATMLCVKPARVGGLSNARTLIERARELGLRPYVGGFFESPYARQVYRVLARHCVEEPSDVGDVAVVGDVDQVHATPTGVGSRVDDLVLQHSRVRVLSSSVAT